MDKFEGIDYGLGDKTAVPYIKSALSYLECEIDRNKIIDAGTHTLYLAKVVGAGNMNKGEPMTYAYYHANRKK